MKSVNPKLLIGLVLVIAMVATLKLMNPNRKYSSGKYWESATITDVYKVPSDALKSGNSNGSVLMWAAMKANDPAIITALVKRGADVNEADIIFSGTPLTGAAGYSKNPKIIGELVRLGADMKKTVNMDETALMIAAQYNKNEAIFKKLISLGADTASTNVLGQTALDLAKKSKNNVAIKVLETYKGKS